MGTIYSYHCQKCGYEFKFFEGMGFFSHLPVKSDMYKDYFSNELTPDIENFFTEYPNGFMSGGRSFVVKCTKCGQYRSAENWNMIVPKNNQEIDICLTLNGVSNFDLIKKIQHPNKCKKCGRQLKPVEIESDKSPYCPDFLECPKCHSKINKSWYGLWD